MNSASYISNSIQEPVVRELSEAIISKLRKAEGGWICLHGETLSGLTTVLHCLCRGRGFGMKSPWLLRMVPMAHLMGIRETFLHAMRLPNDSDTWANTTVIPNFLGRYLEYSNNKVVLVDDVHIATKLNKAEWQRFLNIIQALFKPPYSLIFVLSGNFSIFRPGKIDWPDFTEEPLFTMRKFRSSKKIQEFASPLFRHLTHADKTSQTYPAISFTDAKDIIELTKGYVGEVVYFLTILLREHQCGDLDVTGTDAFSRANRHYWARHD